MSLVVCLQPAVRPGWIHLNACQTAWLSHRRDHVCLSRPGIINPASPSFPHFLGDYSLFSKLSPCLSMKSGPAGGAAGGACKRNQSRLCTSYLGCQNAAFMSGAQHYQKRGYFGLLSSPSGAVGDRCCRSSFRSHEIERHRKAARDFWECGVSLYPPLCALPAGHNRCPGTRQVPLNCHNLKPFFA